MKPTAITGSPAPDATHALDLFLLRIRRYPLLSAAEEVELAKQVEVGDREAAVTSLDKPIGDEQATLGELMAAQQPGPEEGVTRNRVRKLEEHGLSRLATGREVQALRGGR